MIRECRECKRPNPEEAAYCYYDGVALVNGASTAGGSIDFSTLAFTRPFVFPSGAKCHNFMQLALSLHRHPEEAGELLQRGLLESFFGGLGRADLALAAGNLARNPDRERALDELLGKIPGSPLGPAKLEISPEEKNFGVVPVGEDRTFELKLTNKGQRLVQGKIAIDECPWLAVGDGNTPEKLFHFFDEMTIPVTVVGKKLRAFAQAQKGEVVVESNAGNFIVIVQVLVPVRPFSEGVLSGSMSPRQLAEKAKAQVKEAAVLLENGAVARWYEANGWTYPVQGPTATGVAAVQQFFEMLGLVKIPRVELSESAVSLRGKPGEKLEYVLTAMTQEKRPAVAHGVSDQPWLRVGQPVFRGQMASLPLVIDPIPPQPNATLTATVKVTANGNQKFDVPVTLQVADGPIPASVAPTQVPVDTAVAPTLAPAPELAPTLSPPSPPPMPVAAILPSDALAPAVVPLSASAPVAALSPEEVAVRRAKRRERFIRLLPVGIVVLGLLTALFRDLFFRETVEEPLPEIDYSHPLVRLNFHYGKIPGDFVPANSMRFGLGIPDPKDRSKFQTRLIYDEYGRTCNVCVRIDKAIEFLWGVERGNWKPPIRELFEKDRFGNPIEGAKSTWIHVTPPIHITQIVEIVPGGLSADGKKRLLDTCLIRYDITNEDSVPRSVALRFMLDTFIGGNDAVPFTIAGERELCSTMKEFRKPEEVPDFISALEKQDLKNPGTVAHLSLRYGGGLEPPTRVTLGAWPVAALRTEPGGEKALMQDTRWEVPVLPMAKAKAAQNPDGDSAVTLYWDDKDVPPKQTRTVGFAYGLGSVSGDKGEGQLGITAGGELVAEKEFTLTAYVKNPAPGTTITLTLPRALRLTGGAEKESVPAIPPGASSPYSPVTWRVKALRGGVHRVKVTLNTGATLQHRLVVKQAAEIFK